MSKPYSARVWDGEQITFHIPSTGRVFTVKRILDKYFRCIRGFGVFQGKRQVEPYRILDRERLVNWLDTGELVEVVPQPPPLSLKKSRKKASRKRPSSAASKERQIERIAVRRVAPH